MRVLLMVLVGVLVVGVVAISAQVRGDWSALAFEGWH